MRFPRSWLFVPGHSEKMLGKAATLGADAVVLDLEDAVVESEKATARNLVSEFLADVRQANNRNHPAWWVRINALDTAHALQDLNTVVPACPAGILLPKAEHGRIADQVASELNRLEQEHGLTAGSIPLGLIAFETPAGIVNIGSFADLNERVTGFSWGSEDLAAGIGAHSNRNDEGHLTDPYRLARSLCLITAGATGRQAVDTAFLNYKDEAGLRENCAQARRDGFTGKIAIHPAQVGPINEAFTPTDDELERAQAIVQAFADQPDTGTVSLDGKMLDRPHFIQAQRTLSQAPSSPLWGED